MPLPERQADAREDTTVCPSAGLTNDVILPAKRAALRIRSVLSRKDVDASNEVTIQVYRCCLIQSEGVVQCCGSVKRANSSFAN